MACQSQWQRRPADGLVTGLDYAGVYAAMRMMRCRAQSEDLFESIRMMESEVVKIANERDGNRD